VAVPLSGSAPGAIISQQRDHLRVYPRQRRLPIRAVRPRPAPRGMRRSVQAINGILTGVEWPAGEHPVLLARAREAVDLVGDLDSRFLRGAGTYWTQHGDMADRARALAHHLVATIRLAEINAYPSAFAVLRVALEHQCIDDLIFRSRRFVQLVSGVSRAQWDEWQRERASGADWTRDILDWSINRRGEVRIDREGMHSTPDDENGQRWSISVYYFLIQQYDALGPRPSDAA
jgi:hypothetical protein